MKVVYKITYPNGKIYIGKDKTGSNLFYFGSPTKEYIEKDFPWEQQQDLTIRKEILFSSETISDSELSQKETEFIKKYESNNPAIGYNILPKSKFNQCAECPQNPAVKKERRRKPNN